MDKARQLLRRQRSYEPLVENDGEVESEAVQSTKLAPETPYSNIDYWIFLLLGVSMLWAWYITLDRSDSQS